MHPLYNMGTITYTILWLHCLTHCSLVTLFFMTSNKAKTPPRHSGPYVIAFDPDTASRRKRRNDRKKSLMVRARELAIISGGEIFVHFHDKLSSKTWAFASSDKLCHLYDTVKVRRDSHTIRCNDNGLAFQTQPIFPNTSISSSQSSTGSICHTQEQSQSSSSAMHSPTTVTIAPQGTSSASSTTTISPTSQAAPYNSTHQQPLSSHQQPSSHLQPSTSHPQPSTSHLQPSLTAHQQPSSHQQPSTSHLQPSLTTHQRPSSHQQPSSPHLQPSKSSVPCPYPPTPTPQNASSTITSQVTAPFPKPLSHSSPIKFRYITVDHTITFPSSTKKLSLNISYITTPSPAHQLPTQTDVMTDTMNMNITEFLEHDTLELSILDVQE